MCAWSDAGIVFGSRASTDWVKLVWDDLCENVDGGLGEKRTPV